MVTGGRMMRLSMPISAAVISFFLTYETDPGSSPTRTSAMQGRRPGSVATSALRPAMMSEAILLPSMSCIVGRGG